MQQESIRIAVEPVGRKFESPGQVVLNVTLHNAGGGPVSVDCPRRPAPAFLQVGFGGQEFVAAIAVRA